MLQDMHFQVELSLYDASTKSAPAVGAKVAPVNGIIHSLFSDMEIALNDQVNTALKFILIYKLNKLKL